MIEGSGNFYEPVIGLEVHVRLDLHTKIFCSDPYVYGKEPNTLVSEISLAYPGTLPRVNKQAIAYAIKMGLACNSEIASTVVFDRKNYFYPDLPKGYQLTQDRAPICQGGNIPIKTGGNIKRVNLTKIHLEEDAGKSIHSIDSDQSQVDFNRAGTALIEIVTEPELAAPEEAHSFMFEIRRLVRSLGISDGNMEQGSLRCDANVSVRKVGYRELGTKVEIKNVNSFNHVKRALETEISRQCSMLDKGLEVISESRTFDPVTGQTHGMRSKETLTDYRYFPDPDLSPVLIDSEWISELQDEVPELQIDKEIRFQKEFGISASDASILTDSRETSDYFERVVEITRDPKSATNWIIGPVRTILNDQNILISEFPVSPEKLSNIIQWVNEGKINHNLAIKQLFPLVIDFPSESIETLVNKLGSTGESEELEKIIGEIIHKFPEEAELLKNGKKKLLGMFMGHIMKNTNGTADPKKAQKILLGILNNG